MALSSFTTRISRRLFRARKSLHQALTRYPDDKSILFILGCQRSGTTLLAEIFQRDLDAKSYGEYSKLTSDGKTESIRLNTLDSVGAVLEKDRPPLITVKPLVESQNATCLLEHFPNSHVLWAYRDYRGVSRSNAKKFGINNGIIDLKPVVNREPNNWRAEKVSDQTYAIVARHYSTDMNPWDAHVLVWYSRNILFFEQSLDQHPNVMLCRYEDLVTHPAEVMQSVYQHVGQRYPGSEITKTVHARSVGKGRDLEISPALRALADDLLARLDSVNVRTLRT